MGIDCKQAAKIYLKRGWSFIPTVPGGKKAAIPWQQYQSRLPYPANISEWFEEEGRGIAIVTGAVSGLVVIDIDEDCGCDALAPYFPSGLDTLTATTPKGMHLYFKHPGVPVKNGVRILPGVDFRGDGGYVVAPPGEGRSWLDDAAKIKMMDLPPEILEMVAKNGSKPKPEYSRPAPAIGGDRYGQAALARQLEELERSIEGERNDDLNQAAFSLGQLVGGGHLEYGQVESSLIHAGVSMGLGTREVESTVKSGLSAGVKDPRSAPEGNIRHNGNIRNISNNGNAESQRVTTSNKLVTNSVTMSNNSFSGASMAEVVKEWISLEDSVFSLQSLYRDLNAFTIQDKNNIRKILYLLREEARIEPVTGKRGYYRPVDRTLAKIDIFAETTTDAAEILLPLDLHDLAEVMPGSLIVVAGTTNAGKTAFCLETVRLNMSRWPTRYLASSDESNARTLRKRLNKFDETSAEDWKQAEWVMRTQGDFHQVVLADGLTVIDYLEVHDNFYEVGTKMAEIHSRLSGGVAVIAIQKKHDQEYGIGGHFTALKSTLYVTLDAGRPNKLRIKKAKYPKVEGVNGRLIEFKLLAGAKFIKSISQERREYGV